MKIKAPKPNILQLLKVQGLVNMEKRLRDQLDKLRKKIEKTEDEIDNQKLEIYAVSTKGNSFRLDVIKITGICNYEGKAGFVYKAIWACDDDFMVETNRWFQTSVDRDYIRITKAKAEGLINDYLLSQKNNGTRLKGEFLNENDNSE